MADADYEELLQEVLGGTEHDELFQRLIGHYDVPAYVRRGLRLETTLRSFFARLERRRREYLSGVTVALRLVARMVRSPQDLRPFLHDERQVELISRLFEQFAPEAPWSDRCAKPARVHRQLRELVASIRRFNRAWRRELAAVDLTAVNEEITRYNRFYPIEKECAFRSSRLATRGFEPVRELTLDSLLNRFPPLPVPAVVGEPPSSGSR